MVCEDALKGAFNESFTECFGQRSRVFDVLRGCFCKGSSVEFLFFALALQRFFWCLHIFMCRLLPGMAKGLWARDT